MDSHARFCPTCGQSVVTFGSATPQSQTVASQAQPQQSKTSVVGATWSIVGAYATILDRFVAQLVDWLILGVIGALFSIPFGLAALFGNPFGLVFASSAYTAYTSIIGIIIPLLYFSYFESTSGQTIGKSLMSIRVVDMVTGARIDFARALIRNMLRIVDFLPFLYIIGVIVIASTPRKQRLGDLAANSVIVKVLRQADLAQIKLVGEKVRRSLTWNIP